ncbi:hypothetical protein PG984_007161 [Apiospora sp. TS-2023a]
MNRAKNSRPSPERGDASALAERCRAAAEARLRSHPGSGQGEAAKAPTDTKRTTVVAEKESSAMSDEQAESDAIFGREKFGFVLYKTADLPSVLEEYLTEKGDTLASGLPRTDAFPHLRSFELLWRRFLEQGVFGDYGRHGNLNGEFEFVHRALTGAKGRHPAERQVISSQSNFMAPETDDGAAAAYRAEHRRRRALPPDGATDGWHEGLHPRYFLVMDKAGFPPVDDVLSINRVALPEVWVYDADWAPPFGDFGQLRDFDGYEGRLRVRFAYNVHINFWPLTHQEGFDLKKLWAQQQDHSKPYPFPGYDLTQEDIRQRVPCKSVAVPWYWWVKMLFVVIIKHQLLKLWRLLRALIGL